MVRTSIPYAVFKNSWIDPKDGGYFPVCCGLKEDDDGNHLKVLEIDLICRWRLTDGKVQIIEVPFETEEELATLKGYVMHRGQSLADEIWAEADELSYPR